MSSFEKFKLLVWKNFLLQKRHKCQSVFEVASPVIFSLFLVYIRCLVSPEPKPAMEYKAFRPTYFNLSVQNVINMSEIKQEGTIAFSPENPLLRKVATDAIKVVADENLGFLSFFFDFDKIPKPLGFSNKEEMEKALTKPNAMKTTLVGIQFDDNMTNATEFPDDIRITLRFPAVMRTPLLEHPLRASWRTNLKYPLFLRPGPRFPEDRYGGKAPGYSPEMFLAVQDAISRQVIKTKTGKNIDTTVYMQRLPQHAYTDDKLQIALERFISMIIMLAFAYTFVSIVKAVTAEKELQLKETMIIMGLPSYMHWAAWFVKQFTFLLGSVIIMVILFKIPFHMSAAVLTYVSWSVLFFFMILYMIASLTFSFMISVFFSRANTASSFMGLAWLTTYSFYMTTQVIYEDISTTTKIIISLFSNSAMGFAFQMMVAAEGTEKGLQWEDFFQPMSYHDPLMPGVIAFMLIFDAVLYMLIAMYVDKIMPGTYGVPLPWYFPFTKSFWCPVKHIPERTGSGDVQYNVALLKVVHDNDEEPKGAKVGVNIKNLTKIYKGKKKAVDNLNLRMYENEITVLLGHNGAGKTTAISMMTGMVRPTSGSATINGYDIVTETELARKSLGICPQHNVLFPDLTVGEHIEFYARLKGVPKTKIKEEVDHFVKLLELEDKRNVLAENLSGGQKRRLSVGAAMCGSSKVVLLDEPTSGLDPAARRSLWDLLLKEKKGRTLILTTHFMDEADVLADRIAIMSGGRLQCFGTPYFLKKHYGTGYKLTVVKAENCDVDKVTRFFKSYVPNIKDNTNIGSELTYILTNEHVSVFPSMLKAFEEVRESLHVTSYGLSVTSLEEVFMKAGVEDAEDDTKETHSRGNSKPHVAPQKLTINVVNVHTRNGSDAHFSLLQRSERNKTPTVTHDGNHQDLDFSEVEKVRGHRLLANHIKAMFLKLAYNSTRSKLVAFIQCVSPIINISISVAISRSWQFISSLPPLDLDLEDFGMTNTLMSQGPNVRDGSTAANIMTAYKDYFKSKNLPKMKVTDVGTRDLGEVYLKMFKADPLRTRYEAIVAATFNKDNVTSWFSNYGYHDSAISLANVNNAILRASAPKASLTIVNHPLPYSVENLVKVMATGSSIGFQFAFNIGFCMAFVTAFIVLFVVKERISGAKLLQRVSGVRPVVMWSCAYIWDWLWLAFIYLFIIATLACYQEMTLSTPTELGRVLLILLIFSVAVIPQHYLASYIFDAPASGFSKMCFLNMFLGCMPFLIVEVLKIPEVGSPKYANIFDWIFMPLPLYCMSRSFRDMAVTSFAIKACEAFCDQFDNIKNCSPSLLCSRMNMKVCCIHEDPYFRFEEPGIGRYLLMMVFMGILMFMILLLIEYGYFKQLFRSFRRNMFKCVPAANEDSDVVAERRKVAAMTATERAKHSLVAKDLTKYFKRFLAVRCLSFAVNQGECFGLLGVNGAGKTTTFRMLTGDSRVSAGDAFVLGDSVKNNLRAVYQNIGYCPQFDALLDNLTARETLRIFCLLRGIPDSVGACRAMQLAATLGFQRHFDKKVYECSGGTKRKISTAVALMGSSPLVYLDEPTTGMDPASKRLTWSAISKAVLSGRSVVLTSHSMEECEALCSRLTVMVRGQLYCLGPLQHLKSKFSQGYTLIVKCKSTNRDENELIVNDYIAANFPDSRLVESYLGINTYYLNDTGLPWSKVFQIMEESKTKLPIEDYSVTQTTLEQVFLRFTRSDTHEQETKV